MTSKNTQLPLLTSPFKTRSLTIISEWQPSTSPNLNFYQGKFTNFSCWTQVIYINKGYEMPSNIAGISNTFAVFQLITKPLYGIKRSSWNRKSQVSQVSSNFRIISLQESFEYQPDKRVTVSTVISIPKNEQLMIGIFIFSNICWYFRLNIFHNFDHKQCVQ
jgi:hypothetical protein